MARTPVLPEATPVGVLSARSGHRSRCPQKIAKGGVRTLPDRCIIRISPKSTPRLWTVRPCGSARVSPGWTVAFCSVIWAGFEEPLHDRGRRSNPRHPVQQRPRSVLGLVPRLGRAVAGDRNRGRLAVDERDAGLDALLRLAPRLRSGDRDRAGRDGRPLGGVLPACARRDPIRGPRAHLPRASHDHRRGP